MNHQHMRVHSALPGVPLLTVGALVGLEPQMHGLDVFEIFNVLLLLEMSLNLPESRYSCQFDNSFIIFKFVLLTITGIELNLKENSRYQTKYMYIILI